MKELALLMFFIGCGYVLIQLMNHFSTTKSRHIFFAYPSATMFNLLWGFVFYLGFGILTSHQLWIRILLSLVLFALLLFLLFQYGLRRNFCKPAGNFYNRILAKRLQRQQEADRLFAQPYTRSDALTFLGLHQSLNADNPQIAKRLKDWALLTETYPQLPYLREMLKQIQQAFSLK